MYKKFLFIFCILLINQCGYSPVYKKDLDKNITIIIVDQKGDREFNNKLFSELKQYQSNVSNNEYKIKIDSNVDKRIISKNTAGKATNFELSVSVIFELDHNNKIQSFAFNESLKIKNIDDTFEQQKYENIVKNNFARSIKEKLITRLNTM
tara:strand:- start:239 stop:691 length:453 start_codon:yes stop_codon:yes gene_type:complete